MNLKNISIIENKLQTLIDRIDNHLENNTRKMDDMDMMLTMIEYHIDDIEIIKQTIKKGNGRLTENDFKHFIIDINYFANDAIKIL